MKKKITIEVPATTKEVEQYYCDACKEEIHPEEVKFCSYCDREYHFKCSGHNDRLDRYITCVVCRFYQDKYENETNAYHEAWQALNDKIYTESRNDNRFNKQENHE